jgi:hypothetical protein
VNPFARGHFATARGPVPSRHFGPIELHIAVDQASLEALRVKLEKAVGDEGTFIATELGRRGAQFMSDPERGAGRHWLAGRWTTSQPNRGAGGGVQLDVYNEIENMVVQTRSHAPGSSRTYPIEGKDLLNILLYGARQHRIFPRQTGRRLQFPASPGIRQSRFAGTALTDQGVAIGRFSGDMPTRNLQVTYVDHPGVVGSRFLNVAEDQLRRIAAAQEPQVAQRVSTRLSTP